MFAKLPLAHLWSHPEDGAGGLLRLLTSRGPPGLDRRQTKVTNLHGEVVIVEENVVGLEVPEEDGTFSNDTYLIDICNTCG